MPSRPLGERLGAPSREEGAVEFGARVKLSLCRGEKINEQKRIAGDFQANGPLALVPGRNSWPHGTGRGSR